MMTRLLVTHRCVAVDLRPCARCHQIGGNALESRGYQPENPGQGPG